MQETMVWSQGERNGYPLQYSCLGNPKTEESGGLQCMVSQRVGLNWVSMQYHAPWKKGYDKPRQWIKKQRHYFANKGPYSQSYGFSNSRVQMWELGHKKSWALKNLCFQTVVLEKTLESPLDNKEIKPVDPKGNLPWIFIGRTDLKLKLQDFGHLMRTDRKSVV